MKTDLYTKFILTVIALALSSIALQHGIPSAFAQSGQPVKVIICDPIRYLVDCADVTYGGVKIQR